MESDDANRVQVGVGPMLGYSVNSLGHDANPEDCRYDRGHGGGEKRRCRSSEGG